MIPQQTIESAKQVSIVNYLLSLGVQPVKYAGVELVYFSPKQDERTPSFLVNPEKNVFHDFSTDERGDVIRLVQYLTGCSFIQAVQILQKFNPVEQTASFFFSGQTTEKTANVSKLILTDVCKLRHGGLWKYVKGRGISQEVASKYLKEIHYKKGNKRSFALGFENDKGGYVLRNPYLNPCCLGSSYITTFPVANAKTINLFEGFFDFLSSCCYFGLVEPRNTTIVLNSVSNLHHVLNGLKSYKQANVYFDNDNAGKRALQQIEATGIKVYDGSTLYANHKDFNDMLKAANSPIHVRA